MAGRPPRPREPRPTLSLGRSRSLPAPFAAAAALFLALGFLVVAAPAAPAHAQDAASGDRSSGYLMPGDRITIQVWRQPEFSGDFFVTEQGVIGHPIFRTIRVAWRDVEEVQPTIREFLLQYEQEPNVVVEAFFRVSVAGEVRQPDVHYLRPGTTLAQAVSLAGGVNDRARTDRVTLRRGGQDYTLDLGDPALPQRNWVVYSGDEIIVSRRVSLFREYFLPVLSAAGSIASIYRVFR